MKVVLANGNPQTRLEDVKPCDVFIHGDKIFMKLVHTFTAASGERFNSIQLSSAHLEWVHVKDSVIVLQGAWVEGAGKGGRDE